MRIIVGISGASGAIYAIKVLEELKKQKVETHLVVSDWGEITIKTETSYFLEDVKSLADYYYNCKDLGAPISSGSFPSDGMVIVPCSMKSLAGIAHGYADNLLLRAADVTIKEQRKLVLVVRETPLNPIHLENMLILSRIGVIIMPPVPSFYVRAQSIDDVVEQTVGKILQQFSICIPRFQQWGGQ
ncbi:MAG: aromatic acid decarboxylase [Spirochaetes bacterium]|nr:MAG: aromatic acid decarboxylase [Spirochaetota bacterium]